MILSSELESRLGAEAHRFHQGRGFNNTRQSISDTLETTTDFTVPKTIDLANRFIPFSVLDKCLKRDRSSLSNVAAVVGLYRTKNDFNLTKDGVFFKDMKGMSLFIDRFYSLNNYYNTLHEEANSFRDSNTGTEFFCLGNHVSSSMLDEIEQLELAYRQQGLEFDHRQKDGAMYVSLVEYAIAHKTGLSFPEVMRLSDNGFFDTETLH